MQRIENGYSEEYYLTRDGKVFNSKTGKYLKCSKKHVYKLKTTENEYKTITLKKLYSLVYKENYCKDEVKDLEGEVWRAVKNTKQEYWVSSKGRVKSKIGYNAILLKPYLTNGYNRIDLMIQGQRQSKLVHRLVAAAFLDVPEDLDMQIHHKDFNPLNNASDNLQWLTQQQHKQIHLNRKKEN